MVTVLVTGLESDEELLQRISKDVGTIFNVTGTKYLVVSSDPFQLKNITDEGEPEMVTPVASKSSGRSNPVAKLEPPKPASVPPPESERRISHPGGPLVGERWRPRDLRRTDKAFTVVAVHEDHLVTDAGRKVQLARLWRYERVDPSEEPASKVS